MSKFKSFRKGSSNANHAGESESNDMFGVPLDSCIPSPNNDVSFLVVFFVFVFVLILSLKIWINVT